MEVPSGVTVRIEGSLLVVEGPKGKLWRSIPETVKVAVDGPKVEVSVNANKATRKVRANVGAIESHLKNMIAGVQKVYEKNLQLVYSHFPVTVEVKGKEVLIKNFLGEKTPRKAKVKGDVKVDVKGQQITVSGINKEDVGQTASNMMRATKIRCRDERVFQDGIYRE
ncbi:50S ribosomal protein L6 [Candidatus Micrarchaeota archaeon]|nr:50S ribosomal protein L6 [Candidatus Micrarchaeota archaeon]